MNSADGDRATHPLFQTGEGGATPTSALQLVFCLICRDTMESLNKKWHSRLPKFTTACPCTAYYGAEFDGLLYAVAAWSPPVARMLPVHWLELRRLAISEDAPKNTATRMIGWMVRDVCRRFPYVTRLISYQDTDVHTGTIYKASGWMATKLGERIDPNGTYNNWLTRPNRKNLSLAPKQRWEKVVRDEPQIVLPIEHGFDSEQFEMFAEGESE